MPDDAILHDLSRVSDETLYHRLVLLRQRFPSDGTAEDYIYRCDTWEMANKAVRAEIRRRRAVPPQWCVTTRRPAFSFTSNRPATVSFIALIVATAVFAALAAGLAG